MEIHDPPTRRVDQVDAFGAFDHVQAWRGQRLVQEPARIFLEQRPGLGVDGTALPRGARIADIDVAFAGILHAAMLSGWRPMGKRAGMRG